MQQHKDGPTVALLAFPGSNCDQDAQKAFAHVFGWQLEVVHASASAFARRPDAVFIPGGFSYGDYLRAGHLASIAPIIPALKAFIAEGGAVMGVCNGFQILTEMGALPGALLPNARQRFVCDQVECLHEPGPSSCHGRERGQTLRLPIAHGEGRYYIDEDGLAQLEAKQQIFLRYADNPNGSTAAIAGICSENGKVFGLMPHPERAYLEHIGGTDGQCLLRAFAATFV
ncbi:MAG: phosphoribosylformylglycinamidine synthase subunit PurQ [Zetaproteobacteria bacterium]|nr:phosphoribosylformylglycinamidine synthase subunit PurQ [Zetaproteobacteria bacterium]